jgi:extracellular matrix regulatory protein A
MKMINIGLGNLISAARLIAVISPDSAPVKRMILEAREGGHVIDGTVGRRTRAVMIMDSGHIVLSALLPETIANRLNSDSEGEKQ